MRCSTWSELPSPPPDKTGWPWTEQSPQLPETMPDGSPWPRISIVTPSYNQGQFIEETIRSVLLQGYPNLEYIIMDGGSTDSSIDIIGKYAPWLTYWVSETDKGQTHAINKGFARVSGIICAWLNSDDILTQAALQAVVAFWQQNTSCHFLTGYGEIVNSTGDTLLYSIRPRRYSFLDLLQYHKGTYLPQPSVFFSRQALQQVNYLDVGLSYAMDVDLWLRIRQRHCLHTMPLYLSKLRSHEAAKTQKDNERLVAEVRRVVLKHLNGVHPLRRVIISLGIRLFYASTLCRRALLHYFDEQGLDALAVFRKAVSVHPGVILSSEGLKLMLRLFLPLSVKRVLFSRP